MIPRYFDLPASFAARAAAAPDSVLLESSRPDRLEHTSLLFSEPVRILQANRPADVKPFFSEAERYLRRGYYLAGYVTYEAGYALVGINDPPSLAYPLASFGVYREPLRFDHLSGRSTVATTATVATASSPSPAAASARSASLAGAPAWPVEDRAFSLDFASYAERVQRILDYLHAGDCYQINLTGAFELPTPTDLLSEYLRLRRAQPTSYGAYLNFDSVQVASFSPELHFQVRDGTLLTRPMKGTSARGRTLDEDREYRAALSRDEKNRAENVMIVDLLRNDMGRLCRYGSVKVPSLFDVEPYGQVLQMTSTVEGELKGRPPLGELFAKLFPSGSVTGAPKRRAMQIVRELETRPRGVYTGAIGFAAPSGEMTFSVAIRTLVSAAGQTLQGAGSGIVVDSRADDEYRECLLKANFIGASGKPFELFETMRLDAGGVRLRNRHLARLEGSACYFGYPFDRSAAEALLDAYAAEHPGSESRLRLRLSHDGRLELAGQPLTTSAGPLKVGLAAEPVDSSDPFLFHKTSRRERQARAMEFADRTGLADLLFLNERGEITEGAISNLFVEIDGRLLTPPLESGLLPGVGRAEVLASRGNSAEAVLFPDDLHRADALYLCSSLRGLQRVQLAAAD